MDYMDLYRKRLNRYGEDYQSRMKNRRIEDFERYLEKSVYYVEFEYGDKTEKGTFEPYSQDHTENLHCFKTHTDVIIMPGTLFWFGEETPWMVYYQDTNKPRGYNKYIMLKMTHLIKWKDREDKQREAWVYLYGQEDNMLKDELKSRSRSDVLYGENLKMSFFVTSINENINKDDYFTIGEGKLKEGYRVTGYDRHSTKGIEFVTVDPIYLYDESEVPYQTKVDEPDDFFWLNGGVD